MGFTLVQRIVRIRFEEEVLQSNHHRIQVEHRFPVFSKDVQTNVALEVDIWVVDLNEKMYEGLRVLTVLWLLPSVCIWPLEDRVGSLCWLQTRKWKHHPCTCLWKKSVWRLISLKKGKVPSSGEIVSVKLSRSAGSAKWVFIVDGKSSSVKSMEGSKLFSSHFK